MKIGHVPANAQCEEVLAAIEQAGVVVIDRAVAPESMDEIAAEMRPWIESTLAGNDQFSGHRTRRTGGLIARSPTGRELVMHPLVLGAAKRLLSHATGIRMHVTQVITVAPGEPAQAIHRDQWA